MGSKVAENAPRALIMDVATHLFGKQGFTGTSMRDIAQGVGVLPGSLYAHINSKETLLVEIVEDGIDRFIAAVEPIVASNIAPEIKLRDAMKAHVEVVADNVERSQVVFHQWRYLEADNLSHAISKRNQYGQYFEDIIEIGKKKGNFLPSLDTKLAARTVLGALNWTPEWLDTDGKLCPSDVGARMSDILIQGLKHNSAND